MMAFRINQNVFFSSMFGSLIWLTVVSVVHGRVFLLDQRNTSTSRDLAEAEVLCATNDARLATAEELRHAVVDCSFSACTRGWLEGGSVGTTVCSNLGSALKAVDVKIEEATEDNTRLDIFCVKDKGVPCGDPPAFPNTRLQGHTGDDIGEDLLYYCLPGHVMPNGQSAFGLMCDSCGEWYGQVQQCVKDKTEAHIDYEDKFTDDHLSYITPTEEEDTDEGPVEHVHGEEVHEEATHIHEGEDTGKEELMDQEQQKQHKEAGGEEAQGEKELSEVGEAHQEVGEGVDMGEDEGDMTDHLVDKEKQEKTDVLEATEAPVSLLSQKHLFWFPSEAFQEAGHGGSPQPPNTQDTPPEGDSRVRASGSESDESKEDSHIDQTKDDDSHERLFQQPMGREDDIDHEQIDLKHTHDNQSEPDHDDLDDQTDPDQDESSERVFDGDDNVDHEVHESYESEEAHREHRGEKSEGDHEKGGRYNDDDGQNEHYEVGEHEDEDHFHSHGKHDDHEDHVHDDVNNRHGDDHSGPSIHHEDHYEQDHTGVHEDRSKNDRNVPKYHDHDEHDHDGNDRHSPDDHDDSNDHVAPPLVITTGEPQTVTLDVAGREPAASTDDSWLDGHPVSQEETNTKKVGVISTEEGEETEVQEGVVMIEAKDHPNEVEMSRPTSSTDSFLVPGFPAEGAGPVEKDKDEGWVRRFTPTPSFPSPVSTASDSHSADYATPSLTSSQGNAARPASTDTRDTLDYVHPFLKLHPTQTPGGDDVIDEEEPVERHNRTGHSGEREGETGETGCTGGEEDCPPPPPPSSSRGPTVAAVVVAVCAVAAATAIGAWCYRRKLQKSSIYEMNGKGQSPSRQGQQIEMQQKV
ncbi:hypothetical protein UPYG_G00335250 [Umbra pygmaea]|uniref:Sushi domain-containing protein 5 n=1 Tax=Umbra pygmaea TaxID=75934 RepID=A0ABD0WAC9_UMBPY